MPKDIEPQGEAGEWADLLNWNDQGLISVVAQQHDTGEVLMVAWANRAAVEQTLATLVDQGHRLAIDAGLDALRVLVDAQPGMALAQVEGARAGNPDGLHDVLWTAKGAKTRRGWMECFAPSRLRGSMDLM